MNDDQLAADMLRTISAATAAVTGEDFFRLLVQQLAKVLGVNSAFITECTDDAQQRVRTLAFLTNNAFRDNFEYDLEGTACEGVIAGSVCYYSARVHEIFFPKEVGVESYLGVPVHNTEGEILGHLAIYDPNPLPQQLPPYWQDILQIFAARAGAELDRLHAFAALQKANDELEQRVQERTADLRQANAELDAFAHTVAHDLKSPLAGILGCTELLQTEWADSQDRQRAVTNIEQSGRKMNNIIQELLTLAHLRQAEAIAFWPLDMARILYETQQRLHYLISENKAEIILPVSWPSALGYAPWVEEVWANYLSNAIKYSDGPPHLECGADVLTDGRIRFWLQDNGVGLTAEQQSQLFTPFTRLHQIRATGHGLGLSIVQRIVARMNGDVGVQSQSGQGSRFYFILPAA